jgi:uncharacterized protein YjbK
MTAHREIELKWALSAATHQTLQQRLTELIGQGQLLRQHNHFYDTSDLRMRQARCNVRLRHENGRWQCTVKQKQDSGPAGAHQHDEWEAWLDWERNDAPNTVSPQALPLPAHVRQLLDGADLHFHGGFSNERHTFAHAAAPSGLLCLDKTTFSPTRIDYELEIETAYPAESDSFWAEHLGRWQIPYSQQPLTKFARFLQLKQEKTASR